MDREMKAVARVALQVERCISASRTCRLGKEIIEATDTREQIEGNRYKGKSLTSRNPQRCAIAVNGILRCAGREPFETRVLSAHAKGRRQTPTLASLRRRRAQSFSHDLVPDQSSATAKMVVTVANASY